jgi:hypothetical protein
MATISCAECGDQRTGVPKNTLYCFRCRVLVNIEYWRRRTRRCSCGEVFAPLDRGDRFCSKCDPGLRRHSGTCILSIKDASPHEGRYADPRLPVCVKCLRSPTDRPKLIKALLTGQLRRRRENGWKET